ncbi:MAG: CAP domain-containing protein [Cyanobacteria bacterium P01_C01_bin.120]
MQNNAFVFELINLTNAYREQNGLPRLSLDLDLAEAAQSHSQNMASSDFFAHRDPAGQSPRDRATDAGYERGAVGENIAAGQPTPQAVFNAWLNSPGHRANILSSTWNEIGVGYYYSANDPGTVRYRTYWTQVFGRGDIESSSTNSAPPSAPPPTSSAPASVAANVQPGPVGETPDVSLPEGFDALQYGASYSDLIEAFGYDPAALEAHYLNYGRYEGRSPDLFDAAEYLAAYDDLTEAFGDDLEAATRHYIEYGYSEGRVQIAATFDPAQYLASYDDLINAFGYDLAAAKQHYRQHGQQENRSQDQFNEGRYLASNPDLIQAFGSDLQAATQHYIIYGSSEQRSKNSFDPVAYLAAYTDLQAAFGSDLALATAHYIQHGFAEGRTGG